ncbi:MAG: hypothetical protein RR123_01570 [Clostridia bacterium]
MDNKTQNSDNLKQDNNIKTQNLKYDMYKEYNFKKSKRANGMLVEVEGEGEKCIIICPGGAYYFVSSTEAMPIAEEFKARGYKCYILYYSVNFSHFPTQFEELACAIDFVKKKEHKPVGLVGFSAGGHLVASVSVLNDKIDNLSNKIKTYKKTKSFDCLPSFAVLCYPVISYKKELRHVGSYYCLCGINRKLKQYLSLENQVTKNTCPCFIWHTKTDTCVNYQNSIVFKNALDKQNIINELAIFPTGEHGLALGNDTAPEVKQWPELADNFIKKLKL